MSTPNIFSLFKVDLSYLDRIENIGTSCNPLPFLPRISTEGSILETLKIAFEAKELPRLKIIQLVSKTDTLFHYEQRDFYKI